MPALLHAWFPGQYGVVQALAEILFGVINRINPSGKLPITMEKYAQDNPASASFPTDLNASTINYSEGLFVGYREYERIIFSPSILLDTALSYTTFRLSHCTKLGDLENKEWFVALKWETQHRNCI